MKNCIQYRRTRNLFFALLFCLHLNVSAQTQWLQITQESGEHVCVQPFNFHMHDAQVIFPLQSLMQIRTHLWLKEDYESWSEAVFKLIKEQMLTLEEEEASKSIEVLFHLLIQTRPNIQLEDNRFPPKIAHIFHGVQEKLSTIAHRPTVEFPSMELQAFFKTKDRCVITRPYSALPKNMQYEILEVCRLNRSKRLFARDGDELNYVIDCEEKEILSAQDFKNQMKWHRQPAFWTTLSLVSVLAVISGLSFAFLYN